MVNLSERAFDVVNYRQTTLLVLPSILFAVVTVLVGLRCYGSRLKSAKLAVEDVLCVVGLLMGYALLAIIYVLVFAIGEGLPSSEVLKDHPDGMQRWRRTMFVLRIFWASAVASIQLSCLFFYLRLYENHRTARIVCYTIIGLVGAWYVSTLVTWLNTCRPLPKAFDDTIAGICPIKGNLACALIGTLHAALDVGVVVVPVPAVTSIRMSFGEKWGIMLLFFLGSFCTMCAVLRVDCIIHASRVPTSDPINAAWGTVLMEAFEVSLGTICCCMPTLRPVSDHWLKRWWHPNEGNIELQRCGSNGSSHSETSRIWQGRTGGRVKAFVSLEERSRERDRDLGPNDIHVTKEYIVVP